MKKIYIKTSKKGQKLSKIGQKQAKTSKNKRKRAKTDKIQFKLKQKKTLNLLSVFLIII